MSLLMVLTGLVGIKYAHLLRLNVTAYTQAAFPLFFGVLFSSVTLIAISRGVRLSAQINWPTFFLIWGGLIVSAALFAVNLNGLRNARAMSKAEQEEFRKLKRDVTKFRHIRKSHE